MKCYLIYLSIRTFMVQEMSRRSYYKATSTSDDSIKILSWNVPSVVAGTVECTYFLKGCYRYVRVTL